MIRKSHYLVIAIFCALISTAQASDVDTAKSLIEEMKTTRVKLYVSKCSPHWKNKYDFVFPRTKMLFVGKVLSVGEEYEGRSKVRYKILVTVKGINSAKLETIDIYYPLMVKKFGKNKKNPPPEIGTIKIVTAFRHVGIWREFNFSYCAEEKINEEKATE